MSRVQWSLLETDAVEQLVSILLCSENPDAIRIRPSVGDGGIDVLVPTLGKQRHIDVYQVKYFHQNLKSGQKAQIKKSINRIDAYVAENKYFIENWYLTLPLDPTKENLDWFNELIADYSFPSKWRGLEFLEGLAGKYPAVVDYYANNGVERLNQAILALTNALRTQQAMTAQVGTRQPPERLDSNTGATTLQPHDVREGLAGLHHELNRYDPHYRYSFAVDHEPPEIPQEPYLLAATQDIRPGQCITFKIYARFVEAEVERPAPGAFRIKAEQGSKLWQDLELFHKFGRPFEAPLGTASVDLDLPGGLGGSFEGGALRLSDLSDQATSYEIDLDIIDDSGVQIRTARMAMGPPTRGISGKGVRAHGVETGGAFSLEILTDLETSEITMQFTACDITGQRPARILQGLSFLTALRPPYLINVRPAYGTGSGQPMRINEDPQNLSVNLARLEITEALATIQEFTPVQILIPEPSSLSPARSLKILRTAKILRGETLLDPWIDVQVCLDAGADVDSSHRFAVKLVERLQLKLDGETNITFGTSETNLPVARADMNSITAHDDHRDVRFVPVGDTPASVNYLGGPELLANIPDGQNGRVLVNRELPALTSIDDQSEARP